MTAAEFHQQQLEQQQQLEEKLMTPVYCDKIANTIRIALNTFDRDGIIIGCGSVRFDLDENGSFVSTKKTLFAIDSFGRHYKITVEEI
jgi:hypothetical protein